MTQNSVQKRAIQRMAFKGTVALLSVKEYWYQKLQRQKGSV
jgi:hypothetical protein